MQNFDDEISGAMDLLFGNAIENMKGEVAGALAEYEVNKKRPSITSLEYTKVPIEKIEELKNTKVGFLKNGFKKKLIKAIADGQVEYAEVLAVARTNKIIDRSENPRNNTYVYYYKIADLNGRVIQHDLPMIDDYYSISLDYNENEPIEKIGDVDVVNPSNYQHMYVFHYCFDDDNNYVLLTKEQLNNLGILASRVPLGGFYHILGDGVGYN